MEFLKNWLVGAAVCSIVISVVHSLAPKGNLEKSLKFCTGIIFILFFISPFVSGRQDELDFTIPEFEKSSYEEEFDIKMEANAEAQVEKYIKQKLIEQSTNATVKVDAENKDGSFTLKEIEITCNESQRSKVENLLKNELKISDDVINIKVET